MPTSVNSPIVAYINGQDVNTIYGVTINNRRVNDLPSRNLRIFKLARQDGSIQTSAEYSQKIIILEGYISLASRDQAEAALDALKALVAQPLSNIDIMVAGKLRRFVGTLSNLTETLGGGYCPFSLEFTCPIPYGSDTQVQTLVNGVSNSSSSASYSLAIEGSYKASPLIQVVYSAVSGATNGTVTLTNTIDNIGLSITRTFVAGDILEIDNFNKTAQVNSLDVSRVGRFFSFSPGAQALAYSDNFTTRTNTITISYIKRYV